MEIRDRIIDKSSELFIHGIKSVSMDEIATSLGISKRTLYENFKDKEDILLSCVNIYSEKKKEIFLHAETSSDNIIELFLKLIDQPHFSRFPNLKFFEDIEKYYPKVRMHLLEKRDENFELMKVFLRRGVKEGVIRDNLNIEIAAYIVHDTHSYLFMRALETTQKTPFPFTFQELLFTMLVNFIRGISTPKGIEIIDDFLKENPFKF